MKKRILSTLLALCMVVALLPTVAMAADTDPFAGLYSEDGTTITLTGPVNLSSFAKIDANSGVTTLDLAGNTLSWGGSGAYPATLYVESVNLTIKNGTIESTTDFALRMYTGTTVTLDDVDIKGVNFGVAVGKPNDADNTAVLNVTNKSTITATGESGSYIGDGIRAYSGKVSIDGTSSVTASGSGTGIELYGNVEVEIEAGANVSGNWGATVYGGTLESEGNISGTDTGILVSSNMTGSGYVGEKTVTVTGGSVTGGSGTDNGAVVVAASAVEDTSTGTTDIDLKDGEFKGAITVEESQSSGGTTTDNVDISITGGTFKKSDNSPNTDVNPYIDDSEGVQVVDPDTGEVRDAKTDPTLTSVTWSVGSDSDTATFDQTTMRATVQLPPGTANATINLTYTAANGATTASESATVTLVNGEADLTVTATAEDGTPATYTIRFTAPPETLTVATEAIDITDDVSAVKVTINGESGKFYTIDIKNTDYWFSVEAGSDNKASFIVPDGTEIGIYETSTELTFTNGTIDGWTYKEYTGTIYAPAPGNG